MKINHLDLFSGAGGFSLALQQTIGEENIGWTGFSDIDKYANEVFKWRFPDAEGLGTIVDINPRELPRIDIVTFGFPCQDLSIAGRRKGFKGERSSLFYEATRIIRATKPKYFIFENVKGVFSSNKGEDFTLILQEVADIGYDGQWQLLNTRWFLPQNRERLYFVGHIRGECRPKVFPVGESYFNLNENGQKKRRVVNGLDSNYYKGADGKRTMIKNGGGMGAKTGLYKIYDAYNKKMRKDDICGTLTRESAGRKDLSQGFKVVIENNSKNTGNSGLYKILDDYNNKIKEDGVCGAITQHCSRSARKNGMKVIENNSKIRRLTPTECERLQGFPDGWTEGVSDTQRYKLMGNAITVNVAEVIFEKLYKEKNNGNTKL